MATHFAFLPGKSYGQRSLVGYSPKSSKELDTSEPRAQDKTYIKMVWFCYMLYMFLYILHYILLKILIWFSPETMITDLADPGPCLSIFLPSPPHSWCPSVSAALRETLSVHLSKMTSLSWGQISCLFQHQPFGSGCFVAGSSKRVWKSMPDVNDNPICRTEKETQMYRTDFWTLREKARVGCFKRTASKHVYYLGWNRSPAQVGCMRQALGHGALGRPRGIRWRGRWEGGSGWGTHVNPWLFHFNVWQNPLQ